MTRKKLNNKLNISGNELRKIREERHMSREKLSNMLLLETGIDLSAETIANIENNKRTLGDYEFLFLIKILEIDILNFSKKIIEEIEEEMKKQGYSYWMSLHKIKVLYKIR